MQTVRNATEALNAILSTNPVAGDSIPVLKVFMPETVIDALRAVLASGYISEGPQVQAFEQQLGQWLGAPNVLALNSGTSALQLALRLAGVGPGDEVISTPMTCIATNQPIVLQGARIRWADLDPATGATDPEDVQRKINARTRAIMVMHWGGAPCDLDPIHTIAKAHGLKVIEDACQALGSKYGGACIGSHSDFVCFSFQAVKIMTTGDGGALICRDAKDAERGRLLRWYGMDRRLDGHMKREKEFYDQDIIEPGYKMHMNDLNAAIGIEQLKYVQSTIRKHQAHAARYHEAFRDLKWVRPLRVHPQSKGNDWLYTLRVREVEAFAQAMQAEGIDVSPIHVRNDRYSLFKEFQTPLPGVDVFDAEHVCIPVGWWLKEADVQRIIKAVLKFDACCGHPR